MSRKLNVSANTSKSYGSTDFTSDVVAAFSGDAFSPIEFMSLSESIAQNISHVNSTCMQLQRTLKILSSPKNWHQQNQSKVHNSNVNTNKRIEQISKDLQRLSIIVIRGDKQQKFQLEKLTKEFQTIVEKYTTLQKQVAIGIRKSFSSENDNDSQNVLADADHVTLLQAQQVNADLHFEISILEERERQIKEIEADILDVNDIMKKVGDILHEQSESVGRIETNIETAAVDVELAQRELAKAATHRQNYRRKIIIILIIAVIIGLVVTGIIVGKLKN